MRKRFFAKRFIKDTGGVTAVEFALIATPFFVLLTAILEVTMIIFSNLVLENGVIEASRQIRTGEFQQSGGGAQEFRDLLCSEISVLLGCGEELRIDVQTFSNFGSVQNADTGNDPLFNAGAGSSVVLVEASYTHEIITPIIGGFLANQGDNERVITWAAAFENEPF